MSKIFIACSSSNKIDNKYLELTKELENKLSNHTLIYGGPFGGSMDILDSIFENKIAIWPEQLDNLDIKTENVLEATYKMIELADIIIILPGGIGTLMELSIAIQSKRLNLLNKKIYVINYENFYDKLFDYLNFLHKENFFEKINDYITIINNIGEIKIIWKK